MPYTIIYFPLSPYLLSLHFYFLFSLLVSLASSLLLTLFPFHLLITHVTFLLHIFTSALSSSSFNLSQSPSNFITFSLSRFSIQLFQFTVYIVYKLFLPPPPTNHLLPKAQNVLAPFAKTLRPLPIWGEYTLQIVSNSNNHKLNLFRLLVRAWARFEQFVCKIDFQIDKLSL